MLYNLKQNQKLTVCKDKLRISKLRAKKKWMLWMSWRPNLIKFKNNINKFVSRLLKNMNLKATLRSWNLEYQDFTTTKRYLKLKVGGERPTKRLKN